MKLSVIVPVKDAENYIDMTLSCIKTQTFSDFECILIDNGSTDHSPEIMERFVGSDSRFMLLHEKKPGVSAARNLGIEKATGEYLLFLDADDFESRYLFEKLITAIESRDREALSRALLTGKEKREFEYDLSFSGYQIAESEKTKYLTPEDEEIEFSREEMLLRLFDVDNYQGYVWNKLFRKDIIEKHGLRFREDIYYNEDRLFLVEYVLHANYVKMIPDHLYFYQLQSASAQSAQKDNPTTDRALTEFDAFEEMLKVLKDYKKVRELIKAEYFHKAEITFKYLLNSHRTFGFKDNRFKKIARKAIKYGEKPSDEVLLFEYGRMKIYARTGLVVWMKK